MPQPLTIYEVGGAVRDALLGEPVSDRDWVVVGATPEQMVELGYQPVGRDFPVFLHPVTHEEYALARTERKSGRGYHGFVFQALPTVTLEEDLARRDLTINAIARAADGRLIDPHGGQRDLQAGVLRHVSPAFAEDPVRLLRLARFAARWPRFQVAPETQVLLQQLVDDGEVDALVPERVWQEFARGLMESCPSRMIEVLRDCGALARVLPEVGALFGPPGPTGVAERLPPAAGRLLAVLDQSARQGAALPVRFACLTLDLAADGAPRDAAPDAELRPLRSVARADAISARLKVPGDCRDLARLVARERHGVHQADKLDARALVQLLDRVDAWRRPERFEQLLQVCECEARGGAQDGAKGGPHGPTATAPPHAAGVRLRRAFHCARAVDARAVAARALADGCHGEQIALALFASRVQAVDTDLTST
jgi:tRNA nucleotidyltransferase (CCA-adding enzyme)